MKEGIRFALFRWIVFDLFKYSDTMILNNWCIALRYLLMPIDTFLYFVTDRKSYYNFLTGVYTIEGVKFNGGFLRSLKEGSVFEVRKKYDSGTLEIKTICANHNTNGPCSECGV